MRRKFVQFVAGGVGIVCMISSLTPPILAETNISEVIEQNISEIVQEEVISDQPQEVPKLDAVLEQEKATEAVEQENISEEITEEIPIEENSIQEIEERVEVNEINQEDALSSNLVQDFVTRLYTNCIGRTPSQSEVSYWEGRLRNSQETGTSIANFFANSKEVQQKNLSNMAYIQMLYRAFFGREADDKGLEYWLSEMIKGKSRQQALKAFIDSKEYTNICSNYGIKKGAAANTTTVSDEPPAGYTPVQKFVYRFYSKCLGRVPDQSGINYWSQGLLNKQFTGQEIAYNFVNSKEFKNKNLSNEDYINVMYKVFFGREADQGGKQYWLGMLKSWSRQQVLDAFILSDEFFGICNSYDIIVLDEHAEITGFTRGTGTYDNPYVITKPEQLNLIEKNIKKVRSNTCFVLGKDISLQGIDFQPIGQSEPFEGYFDGKNHTISKLTINRTDSTNVALFAQTAQTANIYNVKLDKVTISNLGYGSYTAAVVGYNKGNVVNCQVAGNVKSNTSYTGGLVAYNDGKVDYSTYTGKVTSTSGKVGGLVSYNTSSGNISRSMFYGQDEEEKCNLSGPYAAGLVSENDGRIDSCGAYSTIEGSYTTGGLIANNYGTVLNSFADSINRTNYYDYSQTSYSSTWYYYTGRNGYYAGGLIGYDSKGKVYNCFSTGELSGAKCRGGLVGISYNGYFENCYSTTQLKDVTYWKGNYPVSGRYGSNCNYNTQYYSYNNGLLIGYSSNAILDTCYGCSDNHNEWGECEGDRTDCKIVSSSQIKTDNFTQLLNSHVANSEWLYWTRRSDTNHGMPYLAYQ